MTCSKPINYKQFIDTTCNTSELTHFLHTNNVLFAFDKPCDRCCSGHLNLCKDVSACDGLVWRRSNKCCNYKIRYSKYSFFSSSHLSLATVTEIIYCWTHKYPQDVVIHETGCSNRTIIDFYNFLQEVCCVTLEEQFEPIGGPGKIIEIDESKFGKRKYNRDKRADGVWVFGGIERDSSPPKCFFQPVTDRSAATIIPIINKWILPGTTILSDCWKAYSSLEQEGSIHSTVNHSIQFISESGKHTNSI